MLRKTIALATLLSWGADCEQAMSTKLKISSAATKNEITLVRVEIEPEYVNYVSDALTFNASFRLRWDGVNKYLNTKTANVSTYDDTSRPEIINNIGSAELRNLYIDYAFDDLILRLGKQQIVWGQLDGYKLMDQLNPQSYEQFILEDFNDSRIGLWSLKADYIMGSGLLELVVTPDDTVSYLSSNDEQFVFTASRFRANIDPFEDKVVKAIQNKEQGLLSNESYAVRYSEYFDFWDYSIAVIHGLDYKPIFELNTTPIGNVLSRTYKQRTLFAASMSSTIGDTVVRSEVGYYPNRSFNERQGTLLPTIVEKDQATIAVAIDLSLPASTLLSIQLIYDQVFSADQNLTRPDNDTLLTVTTKKKIWDEQGELDFRLYTANGIFKDFLIRAKMKYYFEDDTELVLGADVFSGDPSGIYGQFEQNDRVFVSLLRYF
jgi:hypothetical protein